MILTLLTALAAPRVVVVVSDELEPYTQPAESFREAFGEPVRTVSLRGREVEAQVELGALQADPPDVVFAIGAKAAYAATNGLPRTPVVYAQVFDPERYGIAGVRVSGVRAQVSPVTYLSQVQSFFPQVSRIGVLRAKLSDDQRRELETAASELGIELVVEHPASRKAFRRAFHAMADDVDAVWISPDRSMLSPEAFRTAVQEMRRRRKPLLGDTANMVSAGAAFAVTPSAVGVGEQGVVMVRRVLDGETVGVEDPEALSTALNLRTLEVGGVPYETLMADFADVVIE